MYNGAMINIRRAKNSDSRELGELFEEADILHRRALPQVFQKPQDAKWYEKYLEKIFSDKNAALLVAEEEGELVGLVLVWVRQSANIPILVPRKFAVMENLVVKKEFRKKGIGRQLVEAAEEWIKKEGANLIELNVWEFNQGARDFYEKLGYQTVSRKMQKLLGEG